MKLCILKTKRKALKEVGDTNMGCCLETDFLERKQKVEQTQSTYWQEGGKKRE